MFNNVPQMGVSCKFLRFSSLDFHFAFWATMDGQGIRDACAGKEKVDIGINKLEERRFFLFSPFSSREWVTGKKNLSDLERGRWRKGVLWKSVCPSKVSFVQPPLDNTACLIDKLGIKGLSS